MIYNPPTNNSGKSIGFDSIGRANTNEGVGATSRAIMASSSESTNSAASSMTASWTNGVTAATATVSSAPTSKKHQNVQLSKYSIEVPSAIASLASTSTSSATAILDPSFEPGAYDVVCGRGKGAYNRPGNKHFHKLVAEYIPQYTHARGKVDKSIILNEIVDTIQSLTNPKTGRKAQFVKFSKTEGWSIIGESLAREKCGHAMRQAIQLMQQKNSSSDSKSDKKKKLTRTSDKT